MRISDLSSDVCSSDLIGVDLPMMGRSRVNGNGGFLMATATPAPLPGSLTLIVEGMSCASCVKRVEAVAGRVPGVAESSVNLASEKLTVRTREGFSPTA